MGYIFLEEMCGLYLNMYGIKAMRFMFGQSVEMSYGLYSLISPDFFCLPLWHKLLISQC